MYIANVQKNVFGKNNPVIGLVNNINLSLFKGDERNFKTYLNNSIVLLDKKLSEYTKLIIRIFSIFLLLGSPTAVVRAAWNCRQKNWIRSGCQKKNICNENRTIKLPYTKNTNDIIKFMTVTALICASYCGFPRP